MILDALDHEATGWTPDVGHIINGGMDPLAKMIEYAELINLVHYKGLGRRPRICLDGRGEGRPRSHYAVAPGTGTTTAGLSAKTKHPRP